MQDVASRSVLEINCQTHTFHMYTVCVGSRVASGLCRVTVRQISSREIGTTLFSIALFSLSRIVLSIFVYFRVRRDVCVTIRTLSICFILSEYRGGDCERDDDYLNEPQIYLIGGPRPSSTPFSFYYPRYGRV